MANLVSHVNHYTLGWGILGHEAPKFLLSATIYSYSYMLRPDLKPARQKSATRFKTVQPVSKPVNPI